MMNVEIDGVILFHTKYIVVVLRYSLHNHDLLVNMRLRQPTIDCRHLSYRGIPH